MVKKNKLADTVDKAIDNNDFSQVSDIIEKSVEVAIDLTKTGATALFNGIQKGLRKEEKVVRIPINKDPRFVNQKVRMPNSYFWLRNLFGFLSVSWGLGAIGTFVDMLRFQSPEALFGILVCVVAGVASGYGTFWAHKRMLLEKRFQRYKIEVGDSRVLAIDDFSTAVSLPPGHVVEDLQKLISLGHFPQGRVVENGQLFLLDKDAYKAYKENYRDTIHVKEQPRSLEETETALPDDQRATAIVEYMEHLANLKSQVSSERFQGKIQRLLLILSAIKEAIAKDHSRMDDLNKFVDYYTPTTIRLVEKYLEFEKTPVSVSSLEKSKEDIEKSIETVISAYENLLGELYQEDLLDLSAEMEVMNTVLTQDGLIQKEK